jgi:glycogen debranching enzyme
MDKMGSSIKAMNKGVPATSRDGAPIEMTALLYRALRFVIGLDKKVFAFEYVRLTDNTLLYYKEWANRIERSFNTCYYIPMHCELDFNYHL